VYITTASDANGDENRKGKCLRSEDLSYMCGLGWLRGEMRQCAAAAAGAGTAAADDGLGDSASGLSRACSDGDSMVSKNR